MKKIKVMHFVSGLLSGGAEQMLYNYCKFMNHDKYEFIIVYQHEPVKTCIKKIESIGCKTIRITARNENFINNIKDSIKVIKEEKPDIIHAHMNLMNFCALYAAKKCDVRIRISHSHIAEKDNSFLFNIFATVCKSLIMRYATSLLACGEEAGQYLYGESRMKSGEVKLIDNAIDLSYFAVDDKLRNEIRNKYNIADKFVVGHVGRFSYQKNHERLILIFNKLLTYNKDAVLILVGTGKLEDNIHNLVKKLKIEDKVIFYGTTQNMKEVYSAIDVFVLPSRYEGFPVVSIEVQAADIPAVFSDTIDSLCKVTDAIHFMSLEKSDEEWANKIIEVYRAYEANDISILKSKYDIRSNVCRLDSIYMGLING